MEIEEGTRRFKETYQIETVVENTAHIIRLKNRSLRREQAGDLLQKGNKITLLFSGSIYIAEKKDLRMAAGQHKNAAGVIPLGIGLLLLLIRRIPRLLARVDCLLRYWGLTPGRRAASRVHNSLCCRVYLRLWEEEGRVIGNRAISC